MASSNSSIYSLTGNTLPHDVQRSITARQPIRRSTFLPQTLHFMKANHSKKLFNHGRTHPALAVPLAGAVLIDRFGCNPYRIIETGFETFAATMKQAIPRIRKDTLARLWQDSESSILNELPVGYRDVLEEQFRDLITRFRDREHRKEQIVEQMKIVLQRIRDDDPRIPPPTAGVISEKYLALLVAETGPMRDFKSWRQLMRYAGLNIRMRQSGKYMGKNKISKKGSPLLRKVLNHIVLPLVRSGWLYG
ncbi:MAG TPA: IS110 family transposase, partial [Methylomicrobium sp.]|nr:IS110 family transposase [Methylomicrobium sp.]